MISKCNLYYVFNILLNVNVENNLFLKLIFLNTTILAYFIMLLNPFKACYIKFVLWDLGEWKWEALPNFKPKKILRYMLKKITKSSFKNGSYYSLGCWR